MFIYISGIIGDVFMEFLESLVIVLVGTVCLPSLIFTGISLFFRGDR